jgi:hypothetical protein
VGQALTFDFRVGTAQTGDVPPPEPTIRWLRPMRVRIRISMAVLAPVLLGGCTSTAPPSVRTTGQPAKTLLPYQVRFVNDTATSVAIVGCQGCGRSHELNAGHTWLTAVAGGQTDVTFTHGGSVTGCVHFVNGVLPSGAQTPSAIRISRYSPCADASGLSSAP